MYTWKRECQANSWISPNIGPLSQIRILYKDYILFLIIKTDTMLAMWDLYAPEPVGKVHIQTHI